MRYIWTLDAHECYGPFPGVVEAHRFAVQLCFSSYTLLETPPFKDTCVLSPRDFGMFLRGAA